MRRTLLPIIFGILSGIFACSNPEAQERAHPASVGYPKIYQTGKTEIRIPADPSGRLQVRVSIVVPKRHPIRGNLLVLPGWKFHRSRWLKETRLVELAEKHGLRLVCPEMYTSLYASRYFPETRLKWNPVPGLVWIEDYLIPFLQKKGIFTKKQHNYLLGLSTGARGVVQIGLGMPLLFRGAAAFSGDYDQTQMKQDKLIKAVYGSYERFPDRWKNVDNPQSRATDWRLPIYLAHGTQDRVVPFSQTQRFYRALKKAHPNLRIEFSAPKAGHNFRFWNSELPAALRFLTSLNAK